MGEQKYYIPPNLKVKEKVHQKKKILKERMIEMMVGTQIVKFSELLRLCVCVCVFGLIKL